MSACAIALALLLDASGSIPSHQWHTLAEGHAAAFETASVRRAVRASGPVAVRAWEFSDVTRPLTPWRVLTSDTDADAYARELRAAERTLTGRTATGDAILTVLATFDESPCPDAERILDIATDGPANVGTPVVEARDRAIADGVRVNVLAIETTEGDPEPFARAHLVTPDGFVLRVSDWRDVPRAVVRKIRIELAGEYHGR
jgi:hypothetical protein